MDDVSRAKLEALDNARVLEIVERYAGLCQPDRVRVITDAPEDLEYVRKKSLEQKEELTLATEGHTVHFDGPFDQGRDKEKTKVLIKPAQTLSPHINTGKREAGLAEITELLKGSMRGREMFVSFAVLGPLDSGFSIYVFQITDSAYVVHGSSLLYRAGYEAWKKLGQNENFFHFIHASGRLENGVSADTDKKRIYIDVAGGRVFAVNTQYAGNSVGLKKLAFRLTIDQAVREGWLSEHMFIMGIHPEGKNRVTYFTGAFPSSSGKTSTAMVPGQTIVGDDLAFIKPGANGRAFAANVEQGIFGIIEDVNAIDDPVIYRMLTTPREVIFSNILVHDNKPYWLGMGQDLPKEGVNFSGMWFEGKTDDEGKPIPAAHKNARYIVRLKDLENCDENLNNPAGVPISGIIFGGRDPDIMPPVVEAFDWNHGVFMGASIEGETTAATLGAIGQKKHDPMAIVDFLSVPLGQYLDNYFKFGAALKQPPKIFAVNYFLKENGEYLNHKTDKKVWLLWMEGRVHGEYEAIKSPIGFLPRFEHIAALFKQVFGREYPRGLYQKEFTLRADKLLARLGRTKAYYQAEKNIPEELFQQIERQRQRLTADKP